MTLLLCLLAGLALIELVLLAPGPQWQARKIVVPFLVVGIGMAHGALIALWPNMFTAVLALLGFYRIFNLLRVYFERMHEQYLRRATRRTGVVLFGIGLVVGLAWYGWDRWSISSHTNTVWLVLISAQLLVAVVLLASTLRRFRRTAWPVTKHHYSDVELPTVSVVIPARNETDDLQQCLQSVLASDYPKLEVLVLDDCSQNKRTPEIIRDFAHAGVRFVQGEEPRPTWLAKNQAYDRLADEASGAYLLFCDVDVRFEPDSLHQIITTMLNRKKRMLCILPRRVEAAYGHVALVQAMRYWWELALPRRLFRRPPVLNSCWVIEAAALKAAGGFEAVSRAIVPEAHFARQLIGHDTYSFLRGNQRLGVVSLKSAAEQRATAIRMRYPQLHRRPENVLLTSAIELIFLFLPYAVALLGFWLPVPTLVHILSALAALILSASYQLVALGTHINTWLFALVAQPLVVLADVLLLHYSMWKYEFSTVDWKGRNVCIPVMHVYPRLPKLPNA